MDDFFAAVLAIIVLVVVLFSAATISSESIRACRMEAAAKGYNFKEICG
jgi:hypothetical protein